MVISNYVGGGFEMIHCRTTEFKRSSGEPNPPIWPSNVFICDPETPAETEKLVQSLYAKQGGSSPPFKGQWSNGRYAVLFKPGNHSVTVPVGYYTSVLGLGVTPAQTIIQNVLCENGDLTSSSGALDNFWRSAENFYTKPTLRWNGHAETSMLWAVSQASPLRRVYVDGSLDLYQVNPGCCAGYSSGGFMADSYVAGTVYSGTQQQWLTRNSFVNQWLG